MSKSVGGIVDVCVGGRKYVGPNFNDGFLAVISAFYREPLS